MTTAIIALIAFAAGAASVAALLLRESGEQPHPVYRVGDHQ